MPAELERVRQDLELRRESCACVSDAKGSTARFEARFHLVSACSGHEQTPDQVSFLEVAAAASV